LDLIKHEASGAEHAQHIWPQIDISNRSQIFKPQIQSRLDPDEFDRRLWMKFFAVKATS